MTKLMRLKKNPRKLRQEFVARFGCCALCKSTQKLEVDHIDPKAARYSKKTSKLWLLPEAKRLEELKNCQILCKKCHIKKTVKEIGYDLLPNQLILEIRALHIPGKVGAKALAKRFGLSKDRVRTILRKLSYRDVQ